MFRCLNENSGGASFSMACASFRLNESLRRLPTNTAIRYWVTSISLRSGIGIAFDERLEPDSDLGPPMLAGRVSLPALRSQADLLHVRLVVSEWILLVYRPSSIVHCPSSIVPLFQWPTVHMISLKALPVGGIVLPSPTGMGGVNATQL